MKRFLFLICFCLTILSVEAQNTFPASGNVGIGTASPDWGKLNIAISNGQQTNSQDNSFLAIQDNTYTTAGIINSRINWINANGSRIASFYAAHNAYGTNNADMVFETNNGSASTERLRINFLGNVGIGTSSPQNKLEVVGSSRLGGGVDYGVSTILSVAPGTIGFDAPGMPGARLYISGANGNVGIGTTNPDTKLTVAGTIHSQAVKVDMIGWSDYVFKPTYKLSSIDAVKGFIDKNHHLPDMPSEKEVMKNGIDLGEMVKLQQKKIEELTLYIINQENRINKLEGVINKKRR